MLCITPIASQSCRFWEKQDIPPEPASKALMRNHQLLLGHTGSPSTVADGGRSRVFVNQRTVLSPKEEHAFESGLDKPTTPNKGFVKKSAFSITTTSSISGQFSPAVLAITEYLRDYSPRHLSLRHLPSRNMAPSGLNFPVISTIAYFINSGEILSSRSQPLTTRTHNVSASSTSSTGVEVVPSPAIPASPCALNNGMIPSSGS